MGWRTLGFLILAILCVPASAQAPTAGNAQLRRLAFFEGEWRAAGRTFPEKHGDQAGSVSGNVRYRWVNRGTWLLSEVVLDSAIAYGVTVLIAFDPATGDYRAYAMTNSSPNAIAYTGRWQDSATLVFDGAIDAVGSVRQRVTYRMRPDGAVLFRADESRDGGASFLPDSELLLERVENR